jgi:hypothetical protein
VIHLLFVALLAAGCTGKDSPSGEDDSGSSSGTDDTADTDTLPDVKPEVQEVTDTECYADSDSVEHWSVAISVSDPQDDVAGMGSTVTILDGSDELASYALACLPDSCSGSWSSAADGIDCATGAGKTFRFVIVDEMGNESDPFDYTAPG